ncbi:bidirectional sugar transporter SWEET17-like [Rhododendron vialii]|uniref:bidirectional sugar transporter SWEET17-like n=1 Tax=Rhododendron vialii TaxID=182163 RepID=UPI00265E3302|nr:bidirectional sugar transporter SWEET17-like [Rhododendron vialii]
MSYHFLIVLPKASTQQASNNSQHQYQNSVLFSFRFSHLEMEGLSLVIGVIGNVISVLMFLSPMSTFWRIIKQRSTEEFESLPYICTLLNSSLWTYYGLMKSGELLVATVNGFGIVVEAIYLSIFLIYAPQNTRAKTAILVGILDVGFLAVAIMVTQLALKGDNRIDAMGIMGAGLNIIMYASPLAAMKRVVTTKSVEFMPFFLSFSFFLNGGVWAFYAILVQDYILAVPNGTGFILGSAQLVLYAIYRNPKPSKNGLINGLLEEGHQHEHLILPSDQIISQQES